MTNRPKQIGTAAESAVKRYAQANGFPDADRQPLRGSLDEGDVLLCAGVMAEVKGGKVAETSSDAWLAEAQRQTWVEQVNSRAAVALLVTKRKAVGPANAGLWWAWMPARQLCSLFAEGESFDLHGAPDPWVRMTLAEALHLIRWAGYGSPLPIIRWAGSLPERQAAA